MSWAARRRFFILLVIGAVAVAFLTVVGIATFYEAPSCTDGIRNQDEGGIDCGGSCPYLCTAEEQPPTVLFTKALGAGTGRLDIIALVENKNATAAAKDVPYRALLYGADRTIVGEASGTLDLPPAATVPIFIPGLSSGKQAVTGAFLEIAASAPRWYAMPADLRVIPRVTDLKQGGTTSAPRVEAVLANPGVTTLTNVRAIVLVRDGQGSVIAASETLVPAIAASGRSTAVFTWNHAFPSIPASIEVVPVIPLP